MKVEVAPLGDVLRMRREVAGDVLDVVFDFATEVGGGLRTCTRIDLKHKTHTHTQNVTDKTLTRLDDEK